MADNAIDPIQPLSPEEAKEKYPDLNQPEARTREERFPILVAIALWAISHYNGKPFPMTRILRDAGLKPTQARHEQWWLTLGEGIVRDDNGSYVLGPNAHDPQRVYELAKERDRNSRKKKAA